MAPPPRSKQQVNARLPSDLVDWIATQDGNQTDVIVRALNAMKAGGELATALDAMPVTVDPRIAELERSVLDLTKALVDVAIERDQWRERAKSIVAAGKEPSIRPRGTDPMGRHQSGPVLAGAVPTGLTDHVTPRFRRGSEGEKATNKPR